MFSTLIMCLAFGVCTAMAGLIGTAVGGLIADRKKHSTVQERNLHTIMLTVIFIAAGTPFAVFGACAYSSSAHVCNMVCCCCCVSHRFSIWHPLVFAVPAALRWRSDYIYECGAAQLCDAGHCGPSVSLASHDYANFLHSFARRFASASVGRSCVEINETIVRRRSRSLCHGRTHVVVFLFGCRLVFGAKNLSKIASHQLRSFIIEF